MDKEINLINYLPQILQDKEEYIKVFNVGNKEILCEGQKIKDDIIAKIHKQLD